MGQKMRFEPHVLIIALSGATDDGHRHLHRPLCRLEIMFAACMNSIAQ